MIERFLYVEKKVIENLYNIFKNHQIQILFYKGKYLKLILSILVNVNITIGNY